MEQALAELQEHKIYVLQQMLRRQRAELDNALGLQRQATVQAAQMIRTLTSVNLKVAAASDPGSTHYQASKYDVDDPTQMLMLRIKHAVRCAEAVAARVEMLEGQVVQLQHKITQAERRAATAAEAEAGAAAGAAGGRGAVADDAGSGGGGAEAGLGWQSELELRLDASQASARLAHEHKLRAEREADTLAEQVQQLRQQLEGARQQQQGQQQQGGSSPGLCNGKASPGSARSVGKQGLQREGSGAAAAQQEAQGAGRSRGGSGGGAGGGSRGGRPGSGGGHRPKA